MIYQCIDSQDNGHRHAWHYQRPLISYKVNLDALPHAFGAVVGTGGGGRVELYQLDCKRGSGSMETSRRRKWYRVC